MLTPRAAIIGASKLADAVLLIKVLINTPIKEAPTKTIKLGQEANGIASNR